MWCGRVVTLAIRNHRGVRAGVAGCRGRGDRWTALRGRSARRPLELGRQAPRPRPAHRSGAFLCGAWSLRVPAEVRRSSRRTWRMAADATGNDNDDVDARVRERIDRLLASAEAWMAAELAKDEAAKASGTTDEYSAGATAESDDAQRPRQLLQQVLEREAQRVGANQPSAPRSRAAAESAELRAALQELQQLLEQGAGGAPEALRLDDVTDPDQVMEQLKQLTGRESSPSSAVTHSEAAAADASRRSGRFLGDYADDPEKQDQLRDEFAQYLGFRDRLELYQYIDRRGTAAVMAEQGEKTRAALAFAALLLLYRIGQRWAVRHVAGGVVAGVAAAAWIDAVLCTGVVMVVMPAVLLAWDYGLASARRVVDERTTQPLRPTDAVRRLLFMYLSMAVPLLLCATVLSFSVEAVQATTAVMEVGARSAWPVSRSGVVWLVLAMAARIMALVSVWRWRDFNGELDEMRDLGNALARAFIAWRWVLTLACGLALVLRLQVACTASRTLMALQYPALYWVQRASQAAPALVAAVIERRLGGSLAVLVSVLLLVYVAYGLVYLLFIDRSEDSVPWESDASEAGAQGEADDDGDALAEALNVDDVTAEEFLTAKYAERTRFSPLQALLVRLGCIEDDREPEFLTCGDLQPHSPLTSGIRRVERSWLNQLIEIDAELVDADRRQYLIELMEEEERMMKAQGVRPHPPGHTRLDWLSGTYAERLEQLRRSRTQDPEAEAEHFELVYEKAP
eukprot:ctg_844.g285